MINCFLLEVGCIFIPMNSVALSRWTSGILLAALMIHLNAQAVMTLLFELNRKNIAASSCEKVVRNCNGQCYLNKQIQKETDSPSVPTSRQDPSSKVSKDVKETGIPKSSLNLLSFNHQASFTSLFGDRLIFHPSDPEIQPPRLLS